MGRGLGLDVGLHGAGEEVTKAWKGRKWGLLVRVWRVLGLGIIRKKKRKRQGRCIECSCKRGNVGLFSLVVYWRV